MRPQPAQPYRTSFLAVTLAALALVALVYPLVVFDDSARRVVRPTELDVVLGVVAVLLVLEATRRTVGWVLPPSACIVLFTIYGAVLEFSGAGRFFIDVSFAAFGTRSAPPPAAPSPWPGSCSAPSPGRGWRPR